MSGGSYNYLSYKSPKDIFFRDEDINLMKARLEELGYQDLAEETKNILIDSQSYYDKMMNRLEKIYDVWHAVEWMDSGDSGIEEVEKAVKEYRQ